MNKGPKPIEASIRFWAKVDKTDGCWNWNGAISSTGYGNFWEGK